SGLGNTTGILIGASAGGVQGTQIGGTSAAARNIISGNATIGIELNGSATTNNTVAGNYIGLASNGTTDLGNGSLGIYIHNGASNNTVGGFTDTPGTGAGNVISGNDSHAIEILGPVSNTLIAGNLIGLNAAGTATVPNGGSGVFVGNGATNNK